MYLERSIDMVAAVVAIFRVGAVLVPLDTSYPAERISEILTDSGVGVVITNDTLSDHLGDYYGVRLDINRLHMSLSMVGQSVRGALDGSDAAYLLYTSGSTGRPKGVLVRHDSLCQSVRLVHRLRPDRCVAAKCC